MGRKKESASETKAPPAPPPKEEPKEEQAEEPEDPPVVKNLKEIDDKYLELEREYEKEVQEIRKKYQEKQRPLLEERRDVLSKPAEEGKDSKTGTPALVGFWTQALQNHPAFEDQIEEWDQPVLEYLKDITTVDLTDDPSKGFKVSFHFVENPYFSNEELCVEFQSEQESPYTGDTTAKKITASEIKWKPGKDVTVEKIEKKVKGGGAKKAKQKGKTQEEPRDSIFRHFFRTLTPDMEIPGLPLSSQVALHSQGRRSLENSVLLPQATHHGHRILSRAGHQTLFQRFAKKG